MDLDLVIFEIVTAYRHFSTHFIPDSCVCPTRCSLPSLSVGGATKHYFVISISFTLPAQPFLEQCIGPPCKRNNSNRYVANSTAVIMFIPGRVVRILYKSMSVVIQCSILWSARSKNIPWAGFFQNLRK